MSCAYPLIVPANRSAERSVLASDTALIAATATGDKLALRTLYARHHVRVYRFLLRLVHNEAMAEDLLADVFLAVWRKAGRFAGRSQVSTWLLAIARHKALSALRRPMAEALDDDAAERIEDPADNAEAVLAKRETHAALRDALEELSPAHRRPRLLSWPDDRGGRRNHRRAGRHRQDPDVLRPQAAAIRHGGPGRGRRPGLSLRGAHSLPARWTHARLPVLPTEIALLPTCAPDVA
jgi:RNA polymerase sigma-70 factor, ECF subfamily